jgi:hypothetical protein
MAMNGCSYKKYPPKYKAIMPQDSICSTIEINLKKLYQLEEVFYGETPYIINDICSFQLIYFDKYSQNDPKMKFRKKSKIDKNCIPVRDTLRSNILLYNNGEIVNQNYNIP